MKYSGIRFAIKRTFDVVASLIVLSLISPFLLMFALLIKLEDGGPILYRGIRIGYKGRKIVFYKFRSMVINADKQKAKLMKYNTRKDGPLFKMKDDPRITRIGKHLRKYSIDEIPQLISVIKGDMSIVGPRPHLESEVAHYTKEDFRRLDIIPGITCLPQISGRNSISFRDWIDLDLQYLDQWSLWRDYCILAKTFIIVFQPIISKVVKNQDESVY